MYLRTARSLSEYAKSIVTHYSDVLSENLGSNLALKPQQPFCIQQLLLITPKPTVQDLIYQRDAVFLRKLIYKGNAKYPIPRRKMEVLVNFRPEASRWKSEQPVRRYFSMIAKVFPRGGCEIEPEAEVRDAGHDDDARNRGGNEAD